MTWAELDREEAPRAAGGCTGQEEEHQGMQATRWRRCRGTGLAVAATMTWAGLARLGRRHLARLAGQHGPGDVLQGRQAARTASQAGRCRGPKADNHRRTLWTPLTPGGVVFAFHESVANQSVPGVEGLDF